MALEFKIRSAVGDDIPFIYSTLLRSYRYDSDLGKSTSKSVFFENYQLVLDKILANPDTQILVACNPAEQNVILGYLIHEPTTLHYVFVKEAFRQLGVATALYTFAFDELDSVSVTHVTRSVEPLMRSKSRLVFNPFKLYQKEK